MDERAKVKTETIEVPFKPDEEAPYIFISYAHADRERIFPIIKRLYEKGWRVWYDEGLPVAENYYASLSSHIKNCALFLLFVTENSVRSEFVSEHELLLAVGARKRICLCCLDENAAFTGEAKDAIDIATVSKKNPKTDETGLEAALAGVEELTRFAPRTAVPYTVESVTADDVIPSAQEGDEYEYEKCEGGVRLTRYKGSETDVTIPKIYKGQPVVELERTFECNQTVKTVRIPATVRSIGRYTFSQCQSLTDVFIPASVAEISYYEFWDTKCSIHCAENSAVHQTACEVEWPVVLDPSLDVSEVTDVSEKTAYAFCSYAADKKNEAERIIGQLVEQNCFVVSSGSLDGNEKPERLGGARCFIAFLSKGYIDTKEISWLRMAISAGKPYLLYALDNSPLPGDIDITKGSEQQLRYDKNAQKELAALIEWLDKNGCRQASADIPDYNYTRDTNGDIILTRYTGDGGDVVIPREYAGCQVVRIRDSTFEDCSSLTSVTISDSVTYIGDSAFKGCGNLTSITIPNSVTSIGSSAFDGCSSLTSVTIPDSVTSIGSSAFEGCSNLTSLTIPDSVTSIGDSAFGRCSSLTSVTIPNSVTSIGSSAFEGCSSLTSLTIPDSVTSIGDSAFGRCSSLTSLTIPDSVTSIGDEAFSCCHRLKSVTIPDSVTSIGNSTFEYCSSLISITIPDSVTSIGESAFKGCGNLTSITIPNSVTSIGSSAFEGCSSLTSLTIPDSVTSIGESAFKGCSSLTSVTIPDSITSIGDSAFSGCRSLISVTIPDSVTSIGAGAFLACSSLTSVIIPASITSIGVGAFSGWRRVTSIGKSPFIKLKKLTVYCPEDSAAWLHCEKKKIRHKPLCEYSPTPETAPVSEPTPRKKSHAWLAVAAILLAVIAAAAGVQCFGVFDLLGWLKGLLGGL